MFSPVVFPISAVFDSLPVRRGDSFLEIGSGTGTLSVLAALGGAKRVVATDINPDAVANTTENTKLHGVADKIEARVSDVYGSIGVDEKFDVIFWNVPDCHNDKKDLSILERAVFDPEYKLLQRYLAESETHLTASGRLLVGYSWKDSVRDQLHFFSSKYGWQLKLLNQENSEDNTTIALYELIKKVQG